ncbi:hypothetical protein Rhein_2030 [Rheinheimera sp. A13L]|nr:hypothetical protein Rhein_2030 [Rheinheimera sp. A13L]
MLAHFFSTSSVQTIFEKLLFVYRDFMLIERAILVSCRTKLVLSLVFSAFFRKMNEKFEPK